MKNQWPKLNVSVKRLLIYTAITWAPAPSVWANGSPAPLNYFSHSHGPAASPTLQLGWVITALMLIIFIIIAGLLATGIFRNRQNLATQEIGPENQGMRWIYVGTGISTFILFLLAIYALFTLNVIATPSSQPTLTVTVTGYDWWWKVEYDDDNPAQKFITANEIHIPIGQPVMIKLKSADVIHAFWVPMLAGKTQMIPGLSNQQWLEADTAGIYRGQCTQYCGMQHAHMGLEVVAQNLEEFQAWQDAQRKSLVSTAETDSDKGKQLFLEHCAGCHTVRGTDAKGQHAPDLTHLQSRRLIGAGTLTNTPDHLQQWINHAQDIKPGSRMPSFQFSGDDINTLSNFLSTLN